MVSTDQARFLNMFSLLQHPSASERQKANTDILRLQHNPSIDIWALSKQLLDSASSQHQILGAQLLYHKITQQHSQLSEQILSDVRQYCVQCLSRIEVKGVRGKLAELFAMASKSETEADRWQGFISQIVVFIKEGERALLFGLEVIANLAVFVTRDTIRNKEVMVKQIIIHALSTDCQEVVSESMNALVCWAKAGMSILESPTLLNLVISKGISMFKEVAEVVTESVGYLYEKNNMIPLAEDRVSAVVKNTVETVVRYVLQVGQSMGADEELKFMLAESAATLFSYVGWVHLNDRLRDEIAYLMLSIFKDKDRRVGQQAFTFFNDLHRQPINTEHLVKCWNKALQTIFQTAKYHGDDCDDDISYRLSCREFLQTLYSHYFKLELTHQCIEILKQVIVLINSPSNVSKEMGMFVLLAISEEVDDMPCFSLDEFWTCIINFCCVPSDFRPLEVNCLRFLSYHILEAVGLGLKEKVLESCLQRMTHSYPQIVETSMSVLAGLLESIEEVEECDPILKRLGDFYNTRSNIHECILEKFITVLVEYCLKVAKPVSLLQSIVNHEVQFATSSMAHLGAAIAALDQNHKTEYSFFLRPIRHNILQKLLQNQEDYFLLSCCHVYKQILLLLDTPLDQTDIQIVEASVQMVVTNPAKHSSLLSFLKDASSFSLYTKCALFDQWVVDHFVKVNHALLKAISTCPDNTMVDNFFHFQQSLVLNHPDQYSSYSDVVSVLQMSNKALSFTSHTVKKVILNFYVHYVSKIPTSTHHKDVIKSAFSCMTTIQSAFYQLYFKLLEGLKTHLPPDAIIALMEEVLLLNMQNNVQPPLRRRVVEILMLTVTKNKVNQFKSLMVTLLDLDRFECSMPHFVAELQKHEERLKR